MCGIPEVRSEGLEDIVIKLARSIVADVGPEDIDLIHCFKKGKRQPNPIIVRFKTITVRNKCTMTVGNYARQTSDTFQVSKKFT